LLHLDGELRRLLSWLEASGRGDSTTVIVTSDHGEYFGEHRLLWHSKHLHRPVLDVPLIIKGPRVKPGRTDRRAQGPDLFPTILDLLGVSHDGRRIQGSSLVRDAIERPAVAEWYSSNDPGFREPRFHGRFDRDLRVLRLASHELFEDERGNLELYHLVDDPEEENDLAARRPEVTAELQELLRRWVENHPPAVVRESAAPEIDEEQREKIRALGYMQ
ncbi:MAG: sulfatase family protein, partial [Candidatus Binatia bacterium]